MLYRSFAMGMLVATLAGCTAGGSGPQLWARACQHMKTLDSTRAVPDCERAYEALPPAAADDFARCALKLDAPDPDGTNTRACLGPDGLAYLAPEDTTYDRLTALAAALETHRTRHGRFPEHLDDLAPSTATRDGWDRPLTYTVADGGESFSLCSRGRDGLEKTEDDACEPAFLYFQF